MEMNGQIHAPVDLPSRISSPYEFDIRLGESGTLSGRCEKEKMSCPFQISKEAFQHVACRYSDLAAPAPKIQQNSQRKWK
jgi:hypothetical protein